MHKRYHSRLDDDAGTFIDFILFDDGEGPAPRRQDDDRMHLPIVVPNTSNAEAAIRTSPPWQDEPLE